MKEKVLLDTQVFIYAASEEHESFSKKAAKVFLDEDYDLYLSVVSLWELSIKINLGKLKLPVSLKQAVQIAVREVGIHLLSIQPDHIFHLENLPSHHRDPFDRLLISQAKTENMILLASDKVFDKYKVKRIW